MSVNQSRTESSSSSSSQYRRPARSGSFSGGRANFSGGRGKGGVAVNPSSLSSSQSFKRPNHAQGGQQARASGSSVNSDSSNALAAQSPRNDSNSQPPVRGSAYESVATGVPDQSTNVSTQKSTPAVPKPQASQSAASSSESTAPATPAKAPRDASKSSFPLQFGSISPGFMNGMQIPARTNSAPPNLDEQQRNQAHNDSLRSAPAFPVPSVPKQHQVPVKDGGAENQTGTGEAQQISKAKRHVQVSSATPVAQTQKTPIHPLSGVSMPMSFHQPPVHVQFGAPNPQILPQSMAAASLPMPMSMPLPMGNPQMQQFVPSLQPHAMPPQGMLHQGQSINFTPQMSPQLPPQIGNMGISMGSQFPQQPTGKVGGSRKPVKITHPDTHEELRLDKKNDAYVDGGPSGPRTHSNMSQPLPMTSVPPAHPINYFSNSFNPSAGFFPAPSSVPLASSQIPPSSQAPRFTYPVSQGPQSVSFMNTQYPSKNNSFVHSIGDHSRDVHSTISSVPLPSVPVTIKTASGLPVDKITDLAAGISSLSVGNSESPRLFRQHGEANSPRLQKDSGTWPLISPHELKPNVEMNSSSLPVENKQSTAASSSPAEGMLPSSVHPLLSEDSAVDVAKHVENRKGQALSRSDSISDQQKKNIKKGSSQPQRQVSGKFTSSSSLPPPSEHSNSLISGTTGSVTDKRTPTEGIVEASRNQPSSHSAATADGIESKTVSEGRIPMSEPSRTFSALSSINGTAAGHHSRQRDPLQLNEPLKLGTAGTKETEGSMSKEGLITHEKSSEMSTKSVPLKFSEVVNQTERNPARKAAANSSEVGSLGTVKKDVLEAVDHSKKDDASALNSEISTSLAQNAAVTEISSPSSVLSTGTRGDGKASTSEASFSKSDSLGNQQTTTGNSNLQDERPSSTKVTPSVSDTSAQRGAESTDDVSSDVVSVPKDKTLLSRTKSNVGRGKKKRKEILQKADAAGSSSDLYMAYKGPDEKKEIGTATESTANVSSSNAKQVDTKQDTVSSGQDGQSKAEPDDWEDAADSSTPKLETMGEIKHLHRVKQQGEDHNEQLAKRYSRDFLLKFSEQYSDLPEGFTITPDIAEALLASNIHVPRESYPGPGRIDRSSSRSDRRGSVGDDDKWSKLHGAIVGRDPRMDGHGNNFRPGQGSNFGVSRNPRGQAPSQYSAGILSGPTQSMGSQGGDRWQRATGFQKGLFPPPHMPSQVMHKAEKKYEVGKITDEEQAKQRQLKGILNKLTPQNFEKLFEQVKAVNIDNPGTLSGVIAQIFDKALMEPTFCEMYANFCFHLAGELPDFSADNERITFKRLLLNKCQEEFERGEREQEEADRADEEGEVKLTAEEREEKRITVRRRMLGNIRLIGELYKKKMLTERIMHECIKKLLGEYQNPDEENIEALCKLMSTIGEIIDHPKAKEHMDAYFEMMTGMSSNMTLSSRVRFMLKDAIDLRKNKWQQRRKVEGPKKIDEVHRDAAQERHVQASRLARGPSMNSSTRNRQPVDFGPRGGSAVLSSPSTQMGGYRGLPTQHRGFGNQDARMAERQHSFESRTLSVPLSQRPMAEDSITLGPQGGLARGMSMRGQSSMPTEAPGPGDSRRMGPNPNGYSSVSDRTGYVQREDSMPRYMPDRSVGQSYDQSSIQDRSVIHGNRDARVTDRSSERPLPTSPTIRGRGSVLAHDESSDKVWPEDRLRDMSISAIKEYYSAKDEKEVALCVKELNKPSFYPMMVSIWITDSFERKDLERDLLAKLLVNLSRSQDTILNQQHLLKGFEAALATLEDAVNDAPRAGEFLGRIFARVILENVAPFAEIGEIISVGGEEQGSLVESGLAAEVVGTILETIKAEANGESVVNQIRTSSRLADFRPPNSRKPLRLDKFI